MLILGNMHMYVHISMKDYLTLKETGGWVSQHTYRAGKELSRETVEITRSKREVCCMEIPVSHLQDETCMSTSQLPASLSCLTSSLHYIIQRKGHHTSATHSVGGRELSTWHFV